MASTVMDTLTFALWISAVRRSGCQVLLKGSTGNFCDEQKSCHSRTLAEEAFVEHSNPARIALLLSVVLVLVCCVPYMSSKPALRGLVHWSLMSSQLGFSEIQCGGQPAQEFDDLSVLCGVNVALRNMSFGFFGVQACGYSGR